MGKMRADGQKPSLSKRNRGRQEEAETRSGVQRIDIVLPPSRLPAGPIMYFTCGMQGNEKLAFLRVELVGLLHSIDLQTGWENRGLALPSHL